MAEASTQRGKRKQSQSQSQTQGKLKPRSDVWEHFDRFTDDHGKDKARCKSCRLVLSADTKSGTSSLRGHWKRHEQEGTLGELNPRPLQPLSSHSAESSDRQPGLEEGTAREPGLEEEADGQTDLEEEAGRGPGQEEEASRETSLEEQASGDLARMIALHGYDSSVVEDDFFRSFVRRLNREFRMPSRSAIEEMCDGIFDEARADLFSRLSRTSGRVSLAVVRAETMEGHKRQFLYTECHFIDDEWNLHKVVMDAYEDVPCDGFYDPLSGVPEVCLDPEGLWRHLDINSVTDDISRRDILDRLFMIARGEMDGDIDGEVMHRMEVKFPGAYPRGEPISTTYMDEVLHSIARRLAKDSDLEIGLASGVQDLHLTRQKRQQLLSQLGLDYLWEYGQHWYVCYCSLEVLRKEGSSKVADIGSEYVGLFCNVLGKIYRAIKRISASSSPTSNLCLPELFNVREVLQSELKLAAGDNANVSTDGWLHAKDAADHLKDAMDTLDRSLKDSYLVWSIPLVLDPRYKLRYIKFAFSRAFGSNEAARYIFEVTKQIEKLYADYIEYDGAINGVVGAGAVDCADPIEHAWDEYCRSQDGMTEVTSYLDAETELDRYLDDRLVPPTTEGFDILSWWKVHSSEYPTVARMARDALAMPTSSKLSSQQLAHVRSIIRGYSKKEYTHLHNLCCRL